MSSKAKQVLLWLVIISGALSFVWFLQSRQTKAAQDLSIDMAITRIENKEFKEALFKQSAVEFTDQNGNKTVYDVGTIRFLVQESFKGVSDYEVEIHSGTGGGEVVKQRGSLVFSNIKVEK